MYDCLVLTQVQESSRSSAGVQTSFDSPVMPATAAQRSKMESYIANLARTGMLAGLLLTVWVLVRPATWCCYLVLLHLWFSQTARMATTSASNFVQEVKPSLPVDPLTSFRDPLAHLPPALHQSINQCYTCSYEAQKAHASHSLISRR